tara:strand:+ start:927 stop:1157 length:231 start_codon:yes stop_codon:yes gene_type:complete
MKLIFPLSIALAGEPTSKQETPSTPPVAQEESTVEQAVQMNEQLSEILARIEEMKTAESSIEFEPIKRVELSAETK